MVASLMMEPKRLARCIRFANKDIFLGLDSFRALVCSTRCAVAREELKGRKLRPLRLLIQ